MNDKLTFRELFMLILQDEAPKTIRCFAKIYGYDSNKHRYHVKGGHGSYLCLDYIMEEMLDDEVVVIDWNDNNE